MKKSKKVSKVMKKIKAQEGVMIEEAASPSMMGAQAAPEALDRISDASGIDIAMAEEAARRRSLSMLEEEKEKPMTPKERREKNIAERNLKKFNTKKKMGGGMMNEYKKGGMVRGQGIAIRGTKFKGIF
jgi:hypothetical protein